jgi:hypothetical protein
MPWRATLFAIFAALPAPDKQLTAIRLTTSIALHNKAFLLPPDLPEG